MACGSSHRFPLCVFIVFANILWAASAATEDKSIWQRRNELLTSSRYDADAPPSDMKFGRPLNVQIGMSVTQMHYDIITGNMEMYVWFRMAWLDSRLLFNVSEWFHEDETACPTCYIPVPVMDNMDDYLWTPDVHCITAPDFISGMTETPAYLYAQEAHVLPERAQGKIPWNVYWVRPGQFTAYCKPTLDNFPWDVQKCVLKFESWAYSGSLMNVSVLEASYWHDHLIKTWPTSNEYLMTKFEYGVFPEDCTIYGSGETFCPVRVTVTLSRLPAFYILNAILPMFMMVMLSTLTFWIPVNPDYSGSGERLAYCITSLLTIVAIVLFTADRRPMIADNTWLDNFQATCISLCFLPIVETAFIMWLDGLLSDVGTVQDARYVQQDVKPSGVLEEHCEDDNREYVAQSQEFEAAASLRNMNLLVMFKHHTQSLITPRGVDVFCRHCYPVLVIVRFSFFYFAIPSLEKEVLNNKHTNIVGYSPVIVMSVLLFAVGLMNVFSGCVYMCSEAPEAPPYVEQWRYSRSRRICAQYAQAISPYMTGHQGPQVGYQQQSESRPNSESRNLMENRYVYDPITRRQVPSYG